MIPVIIQARLGSSRLPGKVMMPIGDRTVLGRVVDRCRQARRAGPLVVATSDLASDDPLADHAAALGVLVHRGPERDVLARYVGASAVVAAPEVVRVTSDCPLLCPEVLDDAIGRHQASGGDYTCIDGYPNGLGDVEVVRVDALQRAMTDSSVDDVYWREHVTTFVKDHPDRFRLNMLRSPPESERPSWRFSVDEMADLEVARAVWAAFAPRTDFGVLEILEYCDRHPELTAINRNVKQKTR
jgi:spore coat polysaccharide biosynthesis protein SpsF (cytidylyltransferase family)